MKLEEELQILSEKLYHIPFLKLPMGTQNSVWTNGNSNSYWWSIHGEHRSYKSGKFSFKPGHTLKNYLQIKEATC